MIKDCEVFERKDKCIRCKPNFYLRSHQECRPVSTIQHCLEYDTEANTSECARCTDEYRVLNGDCVRRVNSLGA